MRLGMLGRTGEVPCPSEGMRTYDQRLPGCTGIEYFTDNGWKWNDTFNENCTNCNVVCRFFATPFFQIALVVRQKLNNKMLVHFNLKGVAEIEMTENVVLLFPKCT